MRSSALTRENIKKNLKIRKEHRALDRKKYLSRRAECSFRFYRGNRNIHHQFSQKFPPDRETLRVKYCHCARDFQLRPSTADAPNLRKYLRREFPKMPDKKETKESLTSAWLQLQTITNCKIVDCRFSCCERNMFFYLLRGRKEVVGGK